MNINIAKGLIRSAAVADDTVILESVHGVGKSSIVKQVALEDDYHLETLFLSAQEVGDLIGMPHTFTEDSVAITTWTVPIWLNRMNVAASQGKKCLLFLDELNRAPLDVRQSAMQLVLERQIHEHMLPTVDGVRTLVVAAINPADDYQVDELDPALMDRFLHAEIEVDVNSWLSWARKNAVNTTVCDFISEHPDRLHFTPADGGIGATPRSWAKLGEHMDNAENLDPEIVFQVMKGKVGNTIASQFFTFYKNYVDVVKMSDVEKLVEENKTKVSDIESMGLLISELVSGQEAIRKTEIANQLSDKYTHSNDLTNILAFLYAMEVEICVAFLKKMKTEDTSGYQKLVAVDKELNNKELFKRIINASNKGK